MSRPYRLMPPLPGKKETVTWRCSGEGCKARRSAYAGSVPREWTGSPTAALCGKCSWKKQKQILAERGELVLAKRKP